MSVISRLYLFVASALLIPNYASAVQDTTRIDTSAVSTKYSLFTEIGALAATNAKTPFWLRANQYGIVPHNNPSGIIRLGGQAGLINADNPRKVQLTVAAEAVANLGQPSRLLLPVANATLRFRNIELYIGRRRELFGLVDTLLTSGSFSWSGNALPIPKIQLGTRGFAPLHFTKDFVAINAMFAHGWFGNQDSTQGAYLHQKAFYVRLGKPTHRIQAFAGVLHYAQWGGYSALVPKSLSPDGHFPKSWRAYYYVITAAQTQDDGSGQFSQFDLLNRVGNQLGTMDIGLSLRLSNSSVLAYIQHPYEDKSGVALKNIPDGLYGISWRNEKKNQKSTFILKQVTGELLSTMNQSGFDIKNGNRQYDGADDYFNHGQYRDGWTYNQFVIGTPFLTRWPDTKPELSNLIGGQNGSKRTILSNTRVNMAHIALLGQFTKDLLIKAHITQSINFGRPIRKDTRMPVDQFSGSIEIKKYVKSLNNILISMIVAIDKGSLFNNNLGLLLALNKSI